MSYETQAAQRYRRYADELRMIAEDKTHAKSRDTLLALASECLQMAATFEAIERTNQAVQKRHSEH